MKTAIVLLVFLGAVIHSEAIKCIDCAEDKNSKCAIDPTSSTLGTCDGNVCVTTLTLSNKFIGRTCQATCPVETSLTDRKCCTTAKCNTHLAGAIGQIENASGVVSYSVGVLLSVCVLHLIRSRV